MYKVCKSCGKPIEDNFKFCHYCKIVTHNKFASEKSILVCLLLLIFLGLIGTHKFYVGRILSVIILLIFSITVIGLIVSAVILLIDLINLLSENFRDSEGKYLIKISFLSIENLVVCRDNKASVFKFCGISHRLLPAACILKNILYVHIFQG